MKTSREIVVDGYPVVRASLRGSKHHPTYRELKLLLLNKYGTCYHCGQRLIDYTPPLGQSLPENAATIDHLTPRQIRKRHQKTKKVLSCYRCNQLRNDLTQGSK